MALSTLALTNADILARFASGEPIESVAALAREFSREKSNFSKTIGLLVDAGLLERPDGAAVPTLAADGAEALAAIERANNPAAGAGPSGVLHALILPDHLNPRRHFEQAEVDELAEAIANSQWVSPLLVRPLADYGDHGEVHRLVAGERRWRAVGKLIADGRWPADKPVPVEIRDMDDATHLRIALIENLQRVNLSPLEEARGFDQLQKQFGMKTAEIAEGVGRTQRLIQQRLQLLDLSEDDQARLDARQITVEQARKIVQDRPAPIETSPPQLMLLAEIAARIFGEKTAPQAWREAPVNWTANSDDLYAEIAQKGLARLSMSYHGDRLFNVQFTVEGVRALVENAPDFLTDRAACLQRLRAEGASAKAIANAGEGFVTPWLNEPYEVSPETKKAAEEAARSERQAEAAREAREREAAEESAAGYAKLHAVRVFEREANGLTASDFVERYRQEWKALGFLAPFDVINQDDRAGYNGIVLQDTAALPLTTFGPQGLEALRRMMAMGMNVGAGQLPLYGKAATDEELELLARGGEPEEEEEEEEADAPESDEEEADAEPPLKGDAFSQQIRDVVAEDSAVPQ